MSAAATIAWKQRNQDRVRGVNREYMRRKRTYGNPECHIDAAFARRFGVSVKVVKGIGSLVLCRCKSDEARRILLASKVAA